ncbi:hypothetical protein AAG565_06215 [Fontimonas sp. SYSU GA230001]|uniref:hypothetical protein n=1 Tax=Fontimonas sp. SYSU GA230001 TaxID=3142450 RepID=UPI0032B463BB
MKPTIAAVRRMTMATAALLSVACATTPYQDAYHTRVIQTWVGKDVSKLWASWGPPSRRMTAPDGAEYHVYFQKVARAADATLDADGTVRAGAIDPDCETYFVVPPKSRMIQSARWRGTGCPLHAPGSGLPFLMKPPGPVGF